MSDPRPGPSAKAEEPERFGPYRVESLLGRGGMGEVYLAYDERLDRRVAVKRIRGDSEGNAKQRERFRREARAAAQLNHPAIVRIYDVLETAEGDAIVMEYVEGDPLAERIARGELDAASSLTLAREIADGLAEAHAQGLVHRDLKSSNVLVTAAGRAKILDFGLARRLRSEGVSQEASLTAAGAVVGTVHAMSPEQARGHPVDHRSDLFAFGVLLYEMLTGRSPFRGSDVVDTLRRVVSEAPPPLADLCPELPAALSRLVQGLLQKHPGRRPQNAHEVEAELAEISSDLTRPAAATLTRPPAAASPSAEAETLSAATFDSDDTAATSVIRVLLLADLVDSTRLVESLGDARSFDVSRRHDRLARDLLALHGGLEIDKTDGFLLLFERPADAVAYALAYHQALERLSRELDLELVARTGIHLGEVFLHRNAPADVERGAKPLEVEGLAKPLAARIMWLAHGRQILLSRGAFDLARRAAVGGGALEDPELEWRDHGPYLFKGIDEPIDVCEVGLRGFAPLVPPEDSEKARRAVAGSDEMTLGWRPAVGQRIPQRPHWRLEERLGEGGFGEVWRASHRVTGGRRVFKFCFEAKRLRALQREVTLFRLLRDTLGERDDIAHILDWQFESAPYFLEVEHTEGGDLAEWCEGQGGVGAVALPIRLELVAQVAEALAAAHSVGVLHKDVKPQNVLIHTGADGAPRALITDFGVGLLTDREALAGRGITALGFTESVERDSTGGSLRYLAPELLEGKPATIQADLYSLGVLLYQVVVGDFSRTLAPGWRRDVGDEILAADIGALVDGAPERRPASAAEVARNLRSLERRWQQHRARQAARKFRQRRRYAAGFAATALVVAALLSWQALEARRQAERLRGRAETLINFMLEDLKEKLDPIGRLDILDDAGQQALEYFDSLSSEDLTERTLARYAQALHQIGDVRMAQGDLEAAAEYFRRSLEKSEALAARDPDNDEWLFNLGQSYFWIGAALWHQGQLKEAQEALQSYLDLSLELVERDPDNADWQLEASYGHNNIGKLLVQRGNPALAIEHFREALAIGRRLVALDPGRASWRNRLATAHLELGVNLEIQGELAEALSHYEAHLGERETLLAESPDNARWIRQLGLAHAYVGRILVAQGRLERAMPHHESYLELAERLHAIDESNEEWRMILGVAHRDLGSTLGLMGRSGPALEHLGPAVEILESVVAKSGDALARRNLATALLELGHERLGHGDVERALELAREARECLAPLLESEDQDVRAYLRLGRAHLLEGRARAAAGHREAAAAAWRRALEVSEPFSDSSYDPRYLDLRARSYLSLGDLERARPVVYRLLGMGYRHPRLVERCRALGWELPE